MNKAMLIFLLMSFSMSVPAYAEETSEQSDGWAKSIIDWTKEKGGTAVNGVTRIFGDVKGKSIAVFDSSKEGVIAAAGFVGGNFIIAKDVASQWSSEQLQEFLTNHPEIADTMEKTKTALSASSRFVVDRTKDGAVFVKEIASDGTASAVVWTKEKISSLPEVSACDIADYDFAGGVAVGTLGTSLIAGASTTTVAVIETTAVLTTFGYIGSAVSGAAVSVVSAPAVATGVTVAALSGATVYATAKGLCYFSDQDAP
jgi:hypothetical protein